MESPTMKWRIPTLHLPTFPPTLIIVFHHSISTNIHRQRRLSLDTRHGQCDSYLYDVSYHPSCVRHPDAYHILMISKHLLSSPDLIEKRGGKNKESEKGGKGVRGIWKELRIGNWELGIGDWELRIGEWIQRGRSISSERRYRVSFISFIDEIDQLDLPVGTKCFSSRCTMVSHWRQ